MEEERERSMGIYYYANGQKKFQGETFDNKYERGGTYYFKNGDYYIGIYNEENNFNEDGIIFYSNGNIKYDGQFLNGKKSGEGRYTWKNGQSYTGYWKDDNAFGTGIYSGPDKKEENIIIS